jgi:hypothetical protein
MHSAAGSPRVRIRLAHRNQHSGGADKSGTTFIPYGNEQSVGEINSDGTGFATVTNEEESFDPATTHIKIEEVFNDFDGVFPITLTGASTGTIDIGIGGQEVTTFGATITGGKAQDAGNSLRNCSPRSKVYRDGFYGKLGKDDSPNGGINSVRFSGDGNSPEIQEFQFEMGYSLDNGTIVGNDDINPTEDFGTYQKFFNGLPGSHSAFASNRPGIDNSPFVASFLLPDSAPIIIKKKPTDRIYASSGIRGRPVYTGQSGVLFTPVNRPR